MKKERQADQKKEEISKRQRARKGDKLESCRKGLRQERDAQAPRLS